MERKRLAIIGGGPKGVAIAAKAHVLRILGKIDIEVSIFEEHGIAANWDGTNGYTDGNQRLGTPPEKDIGYPYRCVFGEDASLELYEYSWASYLVANRWFGRYVDRGKPHPNHREWAGYLRWVASKSNINYRQERVVEFGPAHNSTFFVQSIRERAIQRDYFHGLVITGPGRPIKVAGSDHEWNENIVDGRVFWQRLAVFSQLSDARIAIIGTGETAAGIAVSLVQRAPNIHIDIINRHGTLYTRGESFHENTLYTDSERWRELDEVDREDFIRRTDRGVFSVEAKKIIDQATNVEILTGNVTNIEQHGRVVEVDIERRSNRKRYSYDKVIVAIGFDPLSPLELLSRTSTQLPRVGAISRKKLDRHIRRNIDFHFRIPIPFDRTEVPFSNCHVPNLAALAQGPGFPNLSCLGSLSDRIISAYLDPENEDWICHSSIDDSAFQQPNAEDGSTG